MEFEKNKKTESAFENISLGEIFGLLPTHEKMNEMRIKESFFLSLSLSLLYIEEICLFVVGKDVLSLAFSCSQQAKEKESIDTMR